MKHIIGKRNGKTIVSGGGSLEEQKNNLKHWEILDSVGGDSPKANFAITDPVYYIDKNDVYTVLWGNYFKTQKQTVDTNYLPFIGPNTTELAGNAEGDSYRIYRGIDVLTKQFPQGTSLRATVYLGVKDYNDDYKNILEYQSTNSPNLVLKRSEVFKKYPELDYDSSKYTPDFIIGTFAADAAIKVDAEISESSGGYHITSESYDMAAYPNGMKSSYFLATNPDKINLIAADPTATTIYSVVVQPFLKLKDDMGGYSRIIIK